MNKYKRLGSNTVLVLIGNIGSKLIGFMMLPFYTKWLSTSDYGAFNLIVVYAGLLQGIVSLCISESIFIFPKGVDKKEQKEYFSSGLFIIFINIIITGLIFLSLKLIFSSNNNNAFIQYIWVIYGFVVTTLLQSYSQQFVRSIDKIKVYSYTGIVLTFSIAILSFILIPKFGLYGYLIAQLFSNIISTSYSFILSKSYHYFSVNLIRKAKFKEMLNYSIPLIPNSVMWWVIGALSTPVLNHYLGLNAIGIFSVAGKFPGLLTTLFGIFAISWQISVLEEFTKEGYKEFYNKILKIIFAGLSFISFFITIFSKHIIQVMADERYFEAWKFIPLLTIGVLFSSLSSFVGMNFSAARKSKYYFYSSIWGALTSITLNFILIPRIGLWGATIAIVLSNVSMALSRIIYSWKYVKIVSLSYYINIFIINAIFIITLYFIDYYVLKIGIYLSLFTLFFLINKKLYVDFSYLLSILKSQRIKK